MTPYITASIIIQLLSMDVIPSLTELAKSGANGRKKMDQYTRHLGVVFGFVQSVSLVYTFNNMYPGLFIGGLTTARMLYIATIFTAGTMFLVWIGDQISVKGIGNGVSMVIMAGIVGRMPQQFSAAWETFIQSGMDQGMIAFGCYILIYLLIIVFVTLINTAELKIPIQYTSSSMTLAQNSKMNYLPQNQFSVRYSSYLCLIPDDGSGSDCKLLCKWSRLVYINAELARPSDMVFVITVCHSDYLLYVLLCEHADQPRKGCGEPGKIRRLYS